MRIFLTGGTGFVGGHLLRRLLRDGHSVRALVRRRGSLAKLQREFAKLEEAEGDVSANRGLDSIAGCDAVIHLVGIIIEPRGQSFESMHHLATRNVVDTARLAGVKRFVQMSALGSGEDAASEYHRSKWRGEEEVRHSGMEWVILRPSLIFGPGDGFVSQMLDVMKQAPMIRPVPGTGKYLFRPVYIDDVVECFSQSLTNAAAAGKTVNLVGRDELTLDQILAEIATVAGVRKVPVHLPMPLMKLAAAAFSVFPITPPVTRDQLIMMEQGNTAPADDMRQIFGFEPIGFAEGLRRYLRKSESAAS